MRNLRNVYRSTVLFDRTLPLTATAWDPVTDSLLCTFGPSKESPIIELKRSLDPERHSSKPPGTLSRNDFTQIASWDAPCPLPDLACDEVICLHYFTDNLTACLVLAGGDIVIVREQPLYGEDKIEIVGSVDAGITSAAWSPGEELLVLTTRAKTMLFMSRDIESVADITFTTEDLQASKHVSVGWGKSETQFKGKRAKALRDPTMPEKVDEGQLSPRDTGKVSVSWRGDGAYVAVNTIESGSRRVIRIFSRHGILDSVTEPVDGLEGALSWRPAGNLMAGVQRLADHIDIVFFERNGLRHGRFSLRLTHEEMETWGGDVGLKWNVDSTVLAVCFNDRVQLWTMSNYHYYLKQELMLWGLDYSGKAATIEWHPEQALRLAISSDKNLQNLEYIFRPSSGPNITPHDYGNVAVIDGRHLKLTPLRLSNVPPPMALHELELETNAVDVAFSQSNTRIAVLHEASITIFEWDTDPNPSKVPSIRLNIKTILSPGTYNRQICFYGDSDLLTLGSEHPGALIYHYPIDSVTRMPLVSRSYVHNPIAFGLSRSGHLYANNRLLVKNCTSFSVTRAHLIITTTQHLLKLIHISGVEELRVPLDEPENDERCRSIERGARLITVTPSSYCLTLQMPRGNLETIYPRALVLAGIRRSITSKDYKTAFFACRNQRVDMNILYDHAPQQFLSCIAIFIDQIKKIAHIDLFLSQLREEDVSETMYKETLRTPELLDAKESKNERSRFNGVLPPSMPGPSKVNRICDAFLAILQDRTSTNLQNIITAHVCKTPPDLEAGLLVVSQLMGKETELAEKAVEYICFLVDVNKLYESALGLYDLNLALLVAQQSQMDPREYLPFLRNLQEMSHLRKQYTIDNHLGRYAKALGHLHALKDFDELKAYVEKHELYKDALGLYRYEDDSLKAIMRLYADFLQSHSSFKEAGIAYEYLSDYESASEAYRAANLWRESLTCANTAQLPSPTIQPLARSLADSTAETKDYFSAATIHLDYLEDVETSARVFCKGYHFAEAMRIVSLNKRQDLLESVVDAGLVEALASTTELLADCKTQLAAQVPRLRELRTKKEEDPPYLEGAGATDIADNISLAPTSTSTTGGSLFTRYTNRTGTVNTSTTRKTSKNKRREERKRARGKKGSVYEEEYLVNSIRRLIERVNSVGDEVKRLTEGLLRRGMRERAGAVESVMGDVVDACRGCVEEVFLVGGYVGGEGADDGERPRGGDGVLWDSLEEKSGKREVPLVRQFERLSLLGA
ncbi:MAG: hypothetical protein M1835_004230 [Candelina submexicana]|nr:MAG: hypothetical protein M1835_004230 [Candelina submexicana]